MKRPLVTILIPNYKTLELTKLCLRLIRKHTNLELVHIIVIDNDSQDASLEYLRALSWIELLERKKILDESPPEAHARALDLGLSYVTTPYVLSIHTDTLIKHPNWLHFLLAQFEADPEIAGVGSWKIEMKSLWRRCLKIIERFTQMTLYMTLGKKHHALNGVGKNNYYYLRSHCAMYRMEVIRKLNLHFADGDMVAGKHMHKSMVEAGYKMLFLPSGRLIKYLEHINHATSVLNPELSSRQKSVDQGLHRIEKSLLRMNAQAILQDASLDGR